MNEDYNVGLDIGVGSVGWCVTDENNNILRHAGKNMWGSRIFNEAQTAKVRRTFRSAKRRLNRRKERINILQSLMKEDIEIKYPNFIPLLRETSLTQDDKTLSNSILGKKYNLFDEIEIDDKRYYGKYPTIYHLREKLIKDSEKEDIRLVYLAIHHIIKYRGNFLYENDFSSNTNEINEKLEKVLTYLEDNFDITLNQEKQNVILELSKKNNSKSAKKDNLLKLFNFDRDDKTTITNVINAMLGYSFDLTKIFDIELEKNKISFSSDIENEDEIISLLGENEEIYNSLKTIYSWYILQDILNGKTYISEAFTKKYDEYKKDLKQLKVIYKTYFNNDYNEMFKKVGENNYVAYNGKNAGEPCKKCKPEIFFAKLKVKLQELPDEYEEKSNILQRIEDNNFLKKINVTDNGAIPHQLHEKELKIILENQSKYYKTLAENKEKILQLFSFKIPYYVGPLAKNEEQSKWSWLVRKSNEAIRPWNIEEVIDEDATAEKFITRMTNNCTYLINEKVMPKQSILYSKFCVLNELNNIRVENKHLSKDMKRSIIRDIFEERKKVTAKILSTYLKNQSLPHDNIIGLSDGETFNSNMSSYIDMKRILGKVDEDNINECEDIIYWITIFEDKKILKRKIEKNYGKQSNYKNKLTDEQVSQLVKLRYTGWSSLSKKLIDGLKSNDGETIMEKLESTPLNLMQIINEKEYGFMKKIEAELPKINEKVEYKDIQDIPTSPANKRAIWQSICVTNEIAKIMKREPKNLYIEFARNEEEKKLKDNRAKKLLKIYYDIENQVKFLKDYEPNVYKELKAHQSDKILTEKMYLYYIQNGKCLYSGKPLDFDKLNLYEVDHIIPRSYKKDDSLDNKALVIREYNQMKKDNLLLLESIINGRRVWWESLLQCGLISQTKFYRLTKTRILENDEEREKFVQRQLVETRQITKYVTNLLVNQFKDTEIYAIRAELTHGFRNNYEIYKNRNVNNYHHAQDAYILNTIGNIINQYWTGTGEFKYSEYVKQYFKDKENLKRKYSMMMGFINKHVDIAKVKDTMNYKDYFISRMLEEGTGEFYNQTLYSPNSNVKPVIQLKESLDVNKYGGYSGEKKAYMIIYKYLDEKGKTEYELTGIPVKEAYEIKNKKKTEEGYIKNKIMKDKKYSQLEIVRNHICMNQQYLDENDEPMRFCSDTEIRPDKELLLNENINKLVYLMNIPEDTLEQNQIDELNNNYDRLFKYLLEKLEKEYKIFKNIYEKLKNKQEDFSKLDNQSKKQTINGLISLMETGQGNLKAIGLTDREGRMAGKTFKNDKLLKMTFIDKSVTGMYEKRHKIVK